MDSKKPWQSKTMVLNALLGLASAVALFWPAANVVPQFVQAHGAEVGMVWALLGIVLRAVTKDRISLID